MTTPVPDPALTLAWRALVVDAVESVAAQEVLNVAGCWGRHARYRRADGAPLDVAERAALDQAHADGLIDNGTPCAGRYRHMRLTPAGWQLLSVSWASARRTQSTP